MMTYKVEIKGNDKETSAEIEDLKELKKLLEEYTSTDEVKVEKVIKIKLQVIDMLKIKDNVDLKELEKFGWHLRKNCITEKNGSYTKGATEIDLDDRIIQPYYAGFSSYDYEYVYDLIKADLVEKIDDQKVRDNMTNNNKHVIGQIIKELKKIEKDDEVIVNFIPNQIEDKFSSIGFNKDYVILKNVIEIISKRPIESKNNLESFDD